LVKAHPANMQYRKNLAVAYNLLGLAFCAAYNRAGRQEASFLGYRRAMEIWLDLLNTIPDDPRVLHGLAESFHNIRQLVQGSGHHEEALAMYRSSIDYAPRRLGLLALAAHLGRPAHDQETWRPGRDDRRPQS